MVRIAVGKHSRSPRDWGRGVSTAVATEASVARHPVKKPTKNEK